MKLKRGLSTVVATLVLVLLVVVITGIVWVVVNNIVEDNLDQAQSCFKNFGEVEINSEFTCFDPSPLGRSFRFSITIGEAEIEELLISVSGPTESKSITIGNSGFDSGGLTLTDFSDPLRAISLPGMNGGRTYVLDFEGIGWDPISIQIAPKINGRQCDASDVLNDIAIC